MHTWKLIKEIFLKVWKTPIIHKREMKLLCRKGNTELQAAGGTAGRPL
jgi:hypothetical protein